MENLVESLVQKRSFTGWDTVSQLSRPQLKLVNTVWRENESGYNSRYYQVYVLCLFEIVLVELIIYSRTEIRLKLKVSGCTMLTDDSTKFYTS